MNFQKFKGSFDHEVRYSLTADEVVKLIRPKLRPVVVYMKLVHLEVVIVEERKRRLSRVG
ncbi:MAG: hypothetical protein ACTS7I_00400 [Candidatus Hodgkinia cicadicola]